MYEIDKCETNCARKPLPSPDNYREGARENLLIAIAISIMSAINPSNQALPSLEEIKGWVILYQNYTKSREQGIAIRLRSNKGYWG
ncbi:MAG: hypothetical protein MUO53_01475 [Maribacter sp.]|nr:hypothetical protein [Maribacter sp.]